MTTFNKVCLAGVVLVLIGAGVYYFVGARSSQTAAREMVALTYLRSILREQQVRYEKSKKYVPIDQLREGAPTLDRPPEGYRFELRVKPDGQSFEAIATPVKYGETGRSSFYANEEGSIHEADKRGAEATAADPEL